MKRASVREAIVCALGVVCLAACAPVQPKPNSPPVGADPGRPVSQTAVQYPEVLGPALTPTHLVFPPGTLGLVGTQGGTTDNGVFWFPIPQLLPQGTTLTLPQIPNFTWPQVQLPGGFSWPIPATSQPPMIPTTPTVPPTPTTPTIPTAPLPQPPIVVPQALGFEQEVLNEVNINRQRGAKCGSETFAPAQPLRLNAQLSQAAQGHAVDMATHDYFDHTSRDGRQMSARVTASGYKWSRVGENIAAGRSTAKGTVEQWMNSPGHCSNIMAPYYQELGVGYSHNPKARLGHFWVQNFGAP
jgi:uncharacterized protein YkwD